MAVTLTQNAAAHVRKFMDQNADAIGLRLGVEKTGCSGWGYKIDLALENRESDSAFTSEGIRILIDDDSLDKLDGVTVDFRQNGLNRQFVFDNPNAAEACGCGESFTLESPEQV